LIHKDNLISASDDGAIQIWDLKSGKELQTLKGHQNLVYDILVRKDKLISASCDCTIKIWDLENGKELQTLAGHENGVAKILIHGDNLISASYDCTIKIWDIESGKELQSLKNHERCIKNILVHGDKLISASDDGVILVWDLASRKVLHKLKNDPYSVNEILAYGNKLISPSYDCTIKIWDMKSGKELQTLTEQINRMPTISMNEDKLISSSGNGTIKIWDFGIPSSSQVTQENLAILENQRSEDLHSLFAHLGITAEECSEKLKCRPDFLQKIGILSPADLKALGLKFSSIQHVQIIAEEVTENNNKRQTQAFAKKDAVSTLLQNLSETVQQKIDETMQCSALLYEGNHPWTAFQEQLNSYNAVLEQRCQSPRDLLNTFNPENYAKIVEEVNALIEMFEAIDREHQIAKLRAYVSQPYILGAWNNLHARGINSLAALLERTDAPHDLFQMGE
jgi:hypothetical protein